MLPYGSGALSEDFLDRLRRLKEASGLTWAGLAVAIGVDKKQLLRWRRNGVEPSGGPMLSLVRFAARNVPNDSLDALLPSYTSKKREKFVNGMRILARVAIRSYMEEEKKSPKSRTPVRRRAEECPPLYRVVAAYFLSISSCGILYGSIAGDGIRRPTLQ